MNTPSNTPRTDEERCNYHVNSPQWVSLKFAQTLERELNAALARAEKAEAQVDRLQEKHKRARQVLENITDYARRIQPTSQDEDHRNFLEDLIWVISETTKP